MYLQKINKYYVELETYDVTVSGIMYFETSNN